MLPPEGVLLAAARWIELLKRGESIDRAWATIRNSPRSGALTSTQYVTALEWLSQLGVVVGDGALARSHIGSGLGSALFSICIQSIQPAWLQDADLLIRDPADLPLDGERLADLFGLSQYEAYLAIQSSCRKVDLEARALIGARGERALIELIERKWPGSTTHVSTYDDSAGYDIAVELPEGSWHLEVKTTTRKGRLTVHVSRNEAATSRFDPSWSLVVVGLEGEAVQAIATLRSVDILNTRTPQNTHSKGRWEVCAIDLGDDDLCGGLTLQCGNSVSALHLPDVVEESEFLWMPTR